MRILLTCPCGADIHVQPSRLGRKKYCSKDCKHKYQTRPSGLTYNIKVRNKAWFKVGDKPWNKGTVGVCEANAGSIRKGQHLSRATEFKAGDTTGKKNIKWKGDNVGYTGLHLWVRRHKGLPTECEECGKTDGRIEWANDSYEYRRDLDDWIALCKPCHTKRDMENAWGLATRKFNL